MTSLAMMAGMLPTALAIGKGSEFRQPMAIAVIGGLISSTLLSLVMVPVVYELIDDIEAWLKPRFGRLVTHACETRRLSRSVRLSRICRRRALSTAQRGRRWPERAG